MICINWDVILGANSCGEQGYILQWQRTRPAVFDGVGLPVIDEKMVMRRAVVHLEAVGTASWGLVSSMQRCFVLPDLHLTALHIEQPGACRLCKDD